MRTPYPKHTFKELHTTPWTPWSPVYYVYSHILRILRMAATRTPPTQPGGGSPIPGSSRGRPAGVRKPTRKTAPKLMSEWCPNGFLFGNLWCPKTNKKGSEYELYKHMILNMIDGLNMARRSQPRSPWFLQPFQQFIQILSCS